MKLFFSIEANNKTAITRFPGVGIAVATKGGGGKLLSDRKQSLRQTPYRLHGLAKSGTYPGAAAAKMLAVGSGLVGVGVLRTASR